MSRSILPELPFWSPGAGACTPFHSAAAKIPAGVLLFRDTSSETVRCICNGNPQGRGLRGEAFMKGKAPGRALPAAILVVSLVITPLLHAQQPDATDGTSTAARGKGICHAGQCDFLIAVPVKSFDSGDSNRDLHTLQVVRGGQFPMVTVRTRLPEEASGSATIHADLEVAFAGQTANYK